MVLATTKPYILFRAENKKGDINAAFEYFIESKLSLDYDFSSTHDL